MSRNFPEGGTWHVLPCHALRDGAGRVFPHGVFSAGAAQPNGCAARFVALAVRAAEQSELTVSFWFAGWRALCVYSFCAVAWVLLKNN